MPSEEAAKKRNIERQNELVADSGRIVQLANELSAAVDPEDKIRHRPRMSKKAEEIEKLARSVKELMKSEYRRYAFGQRRLLTSISADVECPVSVACGLGGNRVGDLQEHHAQVEQRGLQQLLLAVGKVSLGFFGQDGEQVDRMACADDVDARLLAGLGGGAHGDDGGKIERLHDLLEIRLGLSGRAGVGLADHLVELDRRTAGRPRVVRPIPGW